MRQAASTTATTASVSALHATVAAHCANLVGIGLARFGYTPLIPALIAAHWFAPSEAVYLGAANLAGYLAGALGARSAASRLGMVATLRGAMLLTTASLLACAAALGFSWFFIWRFVSGCTGGVAMALAAPAVMPSVPVARRGVAGGAIFTGVGLGIAASGTLVPLLIRWGVVETWLGLGGLALVLTAIAWGGWPAATPIASATAATEHGGKASEPLLRALYVEYALNAVGLVPHMVFLVDFIARGLGQGLQAGARYWVIFGIGALIGPLAGGYVGDRFGFRSALRGAYLLQALSVAIPLLTIARVPLEVSSLIVGASVPGIVAITLGRVRELAHSDPATQAAAWRWCTIAFAIGQAIAGYSFSYIFARVENGYPVLFALAASALLLALAVDMVFGATRRRPAVPG
jgi:predicted MFS family arabinose efflux permease